ncbi:MAG TPA: hypothetical protein VFG51_00665 [Candidatus Saccharimonadia bacterium]|nr:hypothetical protein [Candidatus Saccharimonadia bacterium]
MTQTERKRVAIVKFGGSTSTNERGVNAEYLNAVFDEIQSILLADFAHAAFVIGGGKHVRLMQKGVESDEQKDKIGIQVLHQHAMQLVAIARKHGMSIQQRVPWTNKGAAEIFHNNRDFAIALGGLQIGQSTDTVAVTAAELFIEQGYEATICILSNVARIFTADPNLHPGAVPIRRANIHQLVREGVLLDDPAQFRSGMNVTIDPVAVSKLEQLDPRFFKLWFGDGRDLASLRQWLSEQEPKNGTLIVPEQIETQYYSVQQKKKPSKAASSATPSTIVSGGTVQ